MPPDFESLVDKALASLPPEFREQLENVAIVVADRPSRQQLTRSRIKRNEELLGLYEGIPHTERGQGYNLVLPDRITIFRESIEALCHTEEKIEAEVARVLRHEIAHHFGMTDKRLRELNR